METTDKMLERVRKLVAKAEGTDNAEEAEAFLEKAQALMLQHSISEAMLNAARPAESRIKAEALKNFKIAEQGTPIRDQIADLASEVAAHFGCKIVFYGLNRGGARGFLYTTIVGLPSDLRSFQALFTALQLDLASRIRPKVDPAKSFDENVYDLHAAGVTWRNIVLEMHRSSVLPANGPLEVGTEEKIRGSGGRCKTAYRRYCAQIGERPQRIDSPVNYQRNFAAGYVGRVGGRLAESRMKNRSAEIGSALAIRSDGIEELFTEMFPKLGKARMRKDLGYDYAAREAGREAGDQADLGGPRFNNGKRAELS